MPSHADDLALSSAVETDHEDGVRAPQFEFDIDVEKAREWADRAQSALDRGVPAVILIFRGATRQWCMVYDALGKTIYATDTRRGVGEDYELDELHVVYHDEPIPCLIHVLTESSHEEAETVYGQPLSKRRHYYEVLVD